MLTDIPSHLLLPALSPKPPASITLPPVSEITPKRQETFRDIILLSTVAAAQSPSVASVASTPMSSPMISISSLLAPTPQLVPVVKATAPTFRSRHIKPNPLCLDPTHNEKPIQQHTCVQCFLKKAEELMANPHLTVWDRTRFMMRFCRNYRCFCCTIKSFQAKKFECQKFGKNYYFIQRSINCSKGHRAICKMHTCLGHGIKFSICKSCMDPRASGLYRLCGCNMHGHCDCVQPKFDAPQSQEDVDRKDGYVRDILLRAEQMEKGSS